MQACNAANAGPGGRRHVSPWRLRYAMIATREEQTDHAPSFGLHVHRARGARLTGGARPAAQTYGFATLQPGTLNHTTASAVAKVLKEKGGMNVLVQPTAGDQVIIPHGRPRRGRDRHFQRHGGARRHGEGLPRTCASSRPRMRCASAFFVRKDSGLMTVADLKGKRVPYGFSAMRALEPTVRAMLATAGLTEKDIKPVLVPNVIRSADDFVSGAADAFYFAFGAPKVREVDATVGGIRMTEIDEKGMPAARKIERWGYLTQVTPGPVFVGVEKPMKVYSFDNLFFTQRQDQRRGRLQDPRHAGEEQERPDRRAAGAARIHAGIRLQAVRGRLSSGRAEILQGAQSHATPLE